MTISKQNKKRFIQGLFLLPLITCLITVAAIKFYVDYRLGGVCTGIDTKRVFIFISFVLFINVLSSFGALISYWCLENKVNNILKREKWVQNGKKNKL